MKSNVKFNLIIIGILFTLFPIITTNLSYVTDNMNKNLDYSDDFILEKDDLKITAGKIHIDNNDPSNNWSVAKDAGICTGNGTYSKPYVIEDLEIDAGWSGSCILIENSDEYFKIENCTLYNVEHPNACIRLDNVTKGKIIINNWTSHETGIDLLYSNNNTILGNTANNNAYGIYLLYSNNNTISGNTANNNWAGIYLIFGNDNTISGNIANNNAYYGIYLRRSNYNIISGNTLLGNYNCIVEENCQGNEFTDNDCTDGDGDQSISGYNLFFLISILSVVVIIMGKKLKKS